MDFDYLYNREAERFNFLKVPDILVDGEEFKGLSAEANTSKTCERKQMIEAKFR